MRQIARKAVWLWMNHSILGLLVLLCLALALLSDRFFTLGNWANILNNLSVTGIVSLGVALVIISGGIDLSFGSILGCCAVLATWLQPHGFWPAVMGPLVLGAALGAFNGLLVAGIRANPPHCHAGHPVAVFRRPPHHHRRATGPGRPGRSFSCRRKWPSGRGAVSHLAPVRSGRDDLVHGAIQLDR